MKILMRRNEEAKTEMYRKKWKEQEQFEEKYINEENFAIENKKVQGLLEITYEAWKNSIMLVETYEKWCEKLEIEGIKLYEWRVLNNVEIANRIG
ncbi:hypothetical protein C1645_832238 [Glomus cerebriforme]|uniref:Uncharacterized protein n=1 Tax=Glomus cerebriforme TaxID=658196 RepID=A0A397SEN6_9GLOM|nr:hypothetical protein C1645_832238 [Glomus cerebriforme]